MSARVGKYLKNFPINWEANRFSLSPPLTASKISLYSFSCCKNKIKKKIIASVSFFLIQKKKTGKDLTSKIDSFALASESIS